MLNIKDMAAILQEKRRPSTIFRHDMVHDAYREVMNAIGEIASAVAKYEIYRRVADMVKMNPKSVARILNHTRHSE